MMAKYSKKRVWEKEEIQGNQFDWSDLGQSVSQGGIRQQRKNGARDMISVFSVWW